MCECCAEPQKCEKGKDPRTCTPEQIKECHGEAAEHSCEATDTKKDK
jgi:hypothetical protein